MAARTSNGTDGGDKVHQLEVPDRYAAIELADGQFIIYDQDMHTAWIQSDQTVALEAAT